MSLRHSVLGLLALAPATGYELTQKFDRSLSHAWHASHSQIYPELARLQDDGFVEVVEEGARRSRTFALTEAGRGELRRWLTETEPNRSQRNETAVRWFLITLLDPADRRAALDREIAYMEQSVRDMRALADELDALPAPTPFRPTAELGVRVQPVMLEWLRELRGDAS